jgi:hypothetical protein
MIKRFLGDSLIIIVLLNITSCSFGNNSEMIKNIFITETETRIISTPTYSYGEKDTKISPAVTLTEQQILIGKEESIGINIGNTLVKALEAFYEANGRYPSNLDELIPKYISEIPMTITKQPYEYSQLYPSEFNKEPFHLSFVVANAKNEQCSYFKFVLPNKAIWECGLINSE